LWSAESAFDLTRRPSPVCCLARPTTQLEWSRLFPGLYGGVAKRVAVDALCQPARRERHSEEIGGLSRLRLLGLRSKGRSKNQGLGLSSTCGTGTRANRDAFESHIKRFMAIAKTYGCNLIAKGMCPPHRRAISFGNFESFIACFRGFYSPDRIRNFQFQIRLHRPHRVTFCVPELDTRAIQSSLCCWLCARSYGRRSSLQHLLPLGDYPSDLAQEHQFLLWITFGKSCIVQFAEVSEFTLHLPTSRAAQT
jgi:hypothetical protein